MFTISLSNRKILVTGASSGIGRKTAELIAQAGGQVIISGRSQARLLETLSALEGEGHQSMAFDLAEESQIDELVEQLPALDGIVHCAGIVKPLPVKFLKGKQIEEVFKINYQAAALISAKLVRKKKINAGASLVFISSIAGQYPYRGGALYAGSKAALEAFSKTFALEHGKQKIRSNVISPALVKTAIFEETAAANSEAEMLAYEKKYPLGFGEPEDVGNAIVFLLSDAARWITGINLVMDGGLLLGTK